jgi:hypothetical protein
MLAVIAAAWALLVVGCGGREHLSDDYGVNTHRYFMRQRVHAVAARDNPKGLDSEEAAMIQAGYRKDMGGSVAEPKESPSKVLIVQENKGNPGN